MRAVALIDGDHTPQVIRETLAELPYELIGVIFVGGSEKLREDADYGVPLVGDFGEAELVLDLSDEPAAGTSARLGWAARALAAGLPYQGADFRFEPPLYAPLGVPSLAVVGTGKRVGKTAISVHLARLAAAERRVVAVCMGRGGPPQPELVATPPTLAELLARSRAGAHAASDYLEVALLAGVPTVGCRRAGGGLAGGVVASNVAEGAALAATLEPELVVFDGSGAAIPPVAADRRVLVVGPGHDFSTGLNLYRRLVCDLLVSVGCELEGAIPARLRLTPLAPLVGRVAVFSAGPAPLAHLDAELVHVSCNLGNRAALAAELPLIEADTYLTELKGAAIDLVAEHALARGANVVFAGNEVLSDDLDEALLALVSDPVAL